MLSLDFGRDNGWKSGVREFRDVALGVNVTGLNK